MRCDYFQNKFGVDLRYGALPSRCSASTIGGFGGVEGRNSVRLNREGLLQVDRLLHEFFLPEHKNARYA